MPADPWKSGALAPRKVRRIDNGLQPQSSPNRGSRSFSVALEAAHGCIGFVLAYFTVSVKFSGPRVEVVAEIVTVPVVDPVV